MASGDDNQDDKVRWTIRVGTNMNNWWTPSPGWRLLSKVEHGDHDEYIVELVPEDESNEG